MDLPEDKPMTIEEETEKTKRLYPQLLPDKTMPFIPSAPSNIYQEPGEPNRNAKGNNFRLHKINEVQTVLEVERDKRSTLAKKYHGVLM